MAVLFIRLGDHGLWGSEGRWAEIVRNMLLTGDYFHPFINDEVYFDKPLLSYWLMAASTVLTGGASELAIRISCALAGLAALAATRSVARRLWSEDVAQIAGWLLLTNYSFLLWSRTAASDMGNLAAIMIAAAWFFAREHKQGISTYLVFYLILALGGQMKGLLAMVVPALALLPWLLREGRWKNHLKASHGIAIGVGAGLYLAPFLWSAHQPLPEGYSLQREGLGGVELVIRENITRFFSPFDHAGPWYLYFYELPRCLLPWSLLFVGALGAKLKSFKGLDRHTRWLVEAIAVIFLFFSASGSRRWYYILPIVPFCIILIGVFLTEPGWQRTKRACLWITGAGFFPATVLFLVSPLLWPLVEERGFVPVDVLRYGTIVVGILSLAVLTVHWVRPQFLARYTGTDRSLAWLVVAFMVVLGGVFAVQRPGMEVYRTKKSFVVQLRTLVQRPEDLVLFMPFVHAEILFYLNQPQPVANPRNSDDLRRTLTRSSGPKIVVVQKAWLADLQQAVPSVKIDKPVAAEKVMPWEKDRKGKKLFAFRIVPQPS